jgi:hypothetical protein
MRRREGRTMRGGTQKNRAHKTQPKYRVKSRKSIQEQKKNRANHRKKIEHK